MAHILSGSIRAAQGVDLREVVRRALRLPLHHPEASRIGPSGDDHAGVESGDAEPGDNTGSVVRQPAVASTLESTPEAPSNVNVHADSHGVKFDFDQRSPDDDTSGVARPALDFKTIFRSL